MAHCCSSSGNLVVANCHDGVGALFALFDICANLMVCCQLCIRSSFVRLLQFPDSFVLVAERCLRGWLSVFC